MKITLKRHESQKFSCWLSFSHISESNQGDLKGVIIISVSRDSCYFLPKCMVLPAINTLCLCLKGMVWDIRTRWICPKITHLTITITLHVAIWITLVTLVFLLLFYNNIMKNREENNIEEPPQHNFCKEKEFGEILRKNTNSPSNKRETRDDLEAWNVATTSLPHISFAIFTLQFLCW